MRSIFLCRLLPGAAPWAWSTRWRISWPVARYGTEEFEQRAALFGAGDPGALMNRDLSFLLKEVSERALPASMAARCD
ncbi:MAG: hypothetical protein H7345_15425 [Rubritepida sp.]|nr:hypothetical protein [Rubritepida sp.]